MTEEFSPARFLFSHGIFLKWTTHPSSCLATAETWSHYDCLATFGTKHYQTLPNHSLADWFVQPTPQSNTAWIQSCTLSIRHALIQQWVVRGLTEPIQIASTALSPFQTSALNHPEADQFCRRKFHPRSETYQPAFRLLNCSVCPLMQQEFAPPCRPRFSATAVAC